MTVLGRHKAAKYLPEGNAILIGITNLGSDPQEYTGTFVDIWRLQFDDIDHEMDASRFGTYKLFDEGQAGEILGFVSSYPGIDEIVVHCEAGVSRSAGTAAAISLVLGQKEDEHRFFKSPYVPNRHVYRTLLRVAEDMGLIG